MHPVVSPPVEIQTITTSFVSELVSILGDTLYSVYLYGATVFVDGGPVQDIDFHVVLRDGLSDAQKASVKSLHERLAASFPPLGGELDAYYILLEAARRPEPPQHQLQPDIYDLAWALHCAHVRAGFYLTLYGPEPDEIFPAPTWAAVAQALNHELAFVRANLRYPAYCVLNLCRILYSFQTGDVAVSKLACGRWAAANYPQWQPLIEAAARQYNGRALADDQARLTNSLASFLAFMEDEIRTSSC